MAARVTRTPAPKTTPKPPPVAPAAADEDEVPELTTTPSKAARSTGERVVLFRLDGVDYAATRDRSFGAALVYLYGLRTGTSLRDAEFALLEHCVGVDGVKALLTATGLDPELWGRVVRRAVKHVIGKPEKEEGDSGN